MRKQIAFAPLTEAEIDQIADWLRNQTYDVVRERVRKPRSEGGFGLNISRSPLERLHEKTNKVSKINAHIASGEKLTLAKFDAINAGETSASEKVHDAIMSATYDLATSGQNTPAQLLSLQAPGRFPRPRRNPRATPRTRSPETHPSLRNGRAPQTPRE